MFLKYCFEIIISVYKKTTISKLQITNKSQFPTFKFFKLFDYFKPGILRFICFLVIEICYFNF